MVIRSKGLLVLQEIRHLKAAKAARDQELGEAIKQLEAERFQVEELERNLLSQVSTYLWKWYDACSQCTK